MLKAEIFDFFEKKLTFLHNLTTSVLYLHTLSSTTTRTNELYILKYNPLNQNHSWIHVRFHKTLLGFFEARWDAIWTIFFLNTTSKLLVTYDATTIRHGDWLTTTPVDCTPTGGGMVTATGTTGMRDASPYRWVYRRDERFDSAWRRRAKVEEKFEKYFGYSARCEEDFGI